jgi:phenylalanine-4-hydroxylase
MQLAASAPYLKEQRYEDYTPEQHVIWAELVRRRRPQIEAAACQEYLEGYSIVGLEEDRLPNLETISAQLEPRTGWSTTPVSGFLPGEAFFEMLAARMFPTTTRIRPRNSLDYTPEPDIFHDVFGHVPMHAHKVFADFLQHYGAVCAALKDHKQLERIGRLFWYTVEFGLIRQSGEVKVYGSGVISSRGECTNVLNGGCEVADFRLEDVLNTPVIVDHLQKKLFAIESFDQVYEAMHTAERQLGSPP